VADAGNGEVKLDTQIFTSPIYGYKSTINLSLHISRQVDGSVVIWDDGSTFDYRLCTCRFQLPAAQATLFEDLFSIVTQKRGQDLNMQIEKGFFPFGPDLGDQGTFVVRPVEFIPLGISNEPFLHFIYDITFVRVSGPTPAYTIPALDSEGNLQIGTITGLRFPEEWFQPETDYSLNTGVTRDGTPSTIDLTDDADNFDTEIMIRANEPNGSQLVNHIVATIRNNNFNIVSQSNYFPYGRKKGDTGTFVNKLLTNKLEIVHNRNNEFQFPLQSHFISVS